MLKTVEEISDAKEQPGLYAWYAVPAYGVADIEARMSHDGVDTGVEGVRAILKNHSYRYGRGSRFVEWSEPYGSKWRACAADELEERLVQIMLGRANKDEHFDDEIEISKLLESGIKTSRKRRDLLDFIISAFPLLASPIYIGMSENVRRRLNEHVATYRRAREKLQSSEFTEEEIRQKASGVSSNFALRALDGGINEEHLRFIAIYPEKEGKTAMEHLTVTEFLLNRWFRPLYGRR